MHRNIKNDSYINIKIIRMFFYFRFQMVEILYFNQSRQLKNNQKCLLLFSEESKKIFTTNKMIITIFPVFLYKGALML